MHNGRVNIAQRRRDEIVQAAVEVIAKQGIDALSLSAIEKKARMSRGQLTYYFPKKEDILLAVFDHMVATMRRGVEPCEDFEASGWVGTQFLLRMILTLPMPNPTFGALQHTFLAQVGHREDFRQRLASLYEEWRTGMAKSLARDLNRVADPPPYSTRALATVIQALIHGLAVQRAADPDVTADPEVMAVCLDILGSYLRTQAPRPRARPRKRSPKKRAKP
jgi:AcrR family transcriptional regulator